MINENKYIAVLALTALITSLIATALVRRWALACGFVDQPGHRKIHTAPIALGGGIVIFWITIVPLLLVTSLALWCHRQGTPTWLPQALARHLPGLADRSSALFFLIGSTFVLHLIGLIDDKRRLGPWIKLAVQLLIAILLTCFGQIRFSFFIPSPAIATILSILWIVVIVNAFNFLDNMDGLSAGVAVICAAMLLNAAAANQQYFVCALLALLIGALLGFLVFNFAPAKIFLGDGGSLIVGLLIAVATIRTTYYHETGPAGHWFSALMPLIILAVPLYDFISVVLIRLSHGQSPFVGDTRHFSHRLVNRGMTHRQAVLTIYLATAATGLGATFLNQLSPIAALLVFGQTLMILLIIAILEKPPQNNSDD